MPESTTPSSLRALRLLLVDDSAMVGGGQMSLLNYLRRPSEFKRSVIFVDAGPVASQVAATGAEVTVLGPSGPGLGKLKRMMRLAAHLRGRHCDVIVVNSLRAAILVSVVPRIHAVKLLFVHELLSKEWVRRGRLGALKYQFLRLWVLRRFDGLLLNSAVTASTVPKRSRLRVRIAHPVAGVEGPRARDQDLDSAAVPLRVLYLGRVAHWKGVRTLLDAFDLLTADGRDPGLRITIAGDADYGDPDLLPALAARARAHPRWFEHAGFVSDVDEVLERSDVLYSGSLLPEPYGIGVVQALAAGIPVIASRGGGPEEILGLSGAGRLFTAGDAAELAALLEELSHDRPQLARMARSTSDAVLPFLDSRTATELDSAILELYQAEVRSASADRPQ